MAIKSVGYRNVLLTSSELKCFKAARAFQRKVLVRRLFYSDFHATRQGFLRLGWAKNPVIFAVQCSVLLLAMPFLLLWLLLRVMYALLLFPFRYLQTFTVPRDLAAPGEKTLVGIYNAFNRHMNLDTSSYIACMNEWVRILYGDDVVKQFNLSEFLLREMDRLGIEPKSDKQGQVFTPELRSLLGVSREKLSQQLGHYIARKNRSSPVL